MALVNEFSNHKRNDTARNNRLRSLIADIKFHGYFYVRDKITANELEAYSKGKVKCEWDSKEGLYVARYQKKGGK
jgi:hypothetical protein